MKYLTTLLTSKPQIGIIAGLGGGVAGLLVWIHALTISLGFIGAIFGALTAFHTYRIQKKRDQEPQNKHDLSDII